MQDPDDLTEAMREVRDGLFALIGAHERDAHGGKVCWANRAAAIAYLCHTLGFWHKPGALGAVATYLAEYDARCVAQDCPHDAGAESNGRPGPPEAT